MLFFFFNPCIKVVNYYGWSEDDVYRFISQYGFDDKSVAHEMYYAFVSDPGNYCKYVLGMLGFEQLKTKAQSELSDKFNLKNFHQYILDMVQAAIIREEVYK